MKSPWSVLHRSNGSSREPKGAGHAPGAASDKLTDSEVSRRELRQLKWLTALVPGTVVLIYEYARQETLEHVLPALPVQYGNVVVWVLVLLLTYAFAAFVFRIVERLQAQALARSVLLLTYAFAAFVFRIVERLQAQALARSRNVVTLNAVLEERARLSRELHDGFAQLLAYMLVRSVTDDLYQDVRESISELRTRVSERGLPATVRDYVDEYEDRHGITVNLQGEDLARGLPALTAFQLLRIIQEALANVRKHASAGHAWITFRKPDGDRLELVIGDDGTGFDAAAVPDPARKSFGLASMRERVESLGGEMTLESQSGRGTRVIVVLPLRGQTTVSTNGSLAPVTR